MKTNNIVINSIMKNVVRSMRTFLFVIGISLSTTAFAGVVTLNAGTNVGTSATSVTSGIITMKVATGTLNNGTDYRWNAGSSNSMTFTSSGAKMVKIVISGISAGDPTKPTLHSSSSGTLTGNSTKHTLTWEYASGSTEVKFLNATSNQIKFTDVTVTLEGCDLMVWNTSAGKYEVWKTISMSENLGEGPAKPGYTWFAWSSTSSFDSDPLCSYPNNSTGYYGTLRWANYTPTAPAMYAIYTDDSTVPTCYTFMAPDYPTVTVTFKNGGGTGSDYQQVIPQSVATTLTAFSTMGFSKSCNEFDGWSETSGGSKWKDDGGSVTLSANKTLYARWKVVKYTIMTDVSGSGTATIAGEDIVEEDCGTTNLALVATPTSGYYFNGWTKSPNNSTGGTIANAANASTTYNVGTADATLTANFLPYLHVTYDKNTSESVTNLPTDATDYKKNQSVSISGNEVSRSGYAFRGWATSASRANTGTVDYTRGQSSAFSITTNTTLYAVWCQDISGGSLTVSGTTPTFSYSTGKGSTTFSWGSVTGATAYNLVIRNTTDGADVHSGAVSANSEYTFTNMIPGKTYRATVTASNACTETSGYVEKSIACPAIEWPEESEDIEVSTPGKTSATVTFTITNATSFDVWLTDGTADGSEVVGSRSTITANSSGVASKEFTGLTNDHTYYVHATGENICGNETDEKDDVYFETAHQETYDHYQFACVDFTATIPSGKAYVTSGNGKTILAKNPVHLVVSGAVANHYVDIAPSDADVSVYFVKDDKFQVVNGSNQLRIGSDGTFAKDIYFAYTPSAEGDGSVTAPTFTVRCDGFEQTFNGDGSLLKVRALPENFAIIAKVGNIWDILPADMGNTNSTQSAAGVRVDDNACPTIAYTEAGDNAFRIWPIDAAGADRFKSMEAGENGSIIRLSMPNNLYISNALAFGASESSTAVGAFNNATLTASNATAGSHFYWDITTTEETVGGNTYFRYSLKNPTADKFLTLSGKNWGMYASGVQEVRFVKIEETKDAELTAMEWAPSQVALRYPGTGTLELTSASVDGAALGSAHMERLGTSDLYILSDVTLQDNPSKALQIVVEEDVSGVKTSKESQIMIPFIISNGQTKNNSDLRTLVDDNTTNAIIRYVDVVVRKGGKFETDASTKAMFNDLYIYPGGKFEIGGSNNNVSIQNVYLRGGFSWLSNDFALPQMLIANGKAVEGPGASGNGIYYDLYLDNNPYMMALPKDVELADVTNEEGGDDWNAWVKGYTGKNRTLPGKPSGWIYAWYISPGTHLYRGRGYEIGISPRNNRPYGILRFPLMTTSWSDETACAPDVVAWGMTDGELNDGITANNAGWNFIGNPYFSAYNNTVGGESIIIADSLTKQLDGNGNWTGKYDWVEGERVKYFTIPQYTYDEYFDVRATPYKLDAFYPFFVQVSSGTEVSPASLAFTSSNRALKMMSQNGASSKQPREVIVDFTITDEFSKSDVAGLDISDIYSSAFDEDDKEKTIKNGTEYMKIYTLVGEYRVAFNSLPEAKAAQPIPIGVIAPEAGYYTIVLVDGLDITDIEHVWLTDYEKGTQTDLLTEDYRFYISQGQLEDRFAINVILKEESEITTDIILPEVGEQDVPFKFLWNDHIYIMYHGTIYDISGRKVGVINK